MLWRKIQLLIARMYKEEQKAEWLNAAVESLMYVKRINV
jgi:hypothetical protein